MAPTWTGGGYQAPVSAPFAGVAAAPAAPQNPGLAFANGLAAYLRASKHTVDPLVAAGGKPADPAHQLIEGTGARKGMFGTAIKIGGSEFHIYFHPDGRREVIKVAGPGIHGVGVSRPGGLVGGLAAQLSGGMLAPQ